MSRLPCTLLFLSRSNWLERLSCGCTIIRVRVELCVGLRVEILLAFLKGNWMSSSWVVHWSYWTGSLCDWNVFCSGSLFGSVHLQGSLSIGVEVWKCLHVGIFHLQSLEVLWNCPWLKIWMCECAGCRVPVQKVQTDQNVSSQCKCPCIHEFLFSLQELFP